MKLVSSLSPKMRPRTRVDPGSPGSLHETWINCCDPQKVSQKPDILGTVFALPAFILTAFRMWPLRSGGHWTRQAFSHVLWLIFLLATAVLCATSLAETFLRFRSTEKFYLLRMFSVSPHMLMAFRGCITLLKIPFCSKDLHEHMSRAIPRCVPATCLKKVMTKWTFATVFLSVYCAITLASFYTTNWLHGIQYSNNTLTSMWKMYPYQTPIPVWSCITIQAVFLCIPYFLSQLVGVIMVVSGIMVLDCTRYLNKKLEELHKKAKNMLKVDGRLGADTVAFLCGEIEVLMVQRSWMFQIVETWSKTFGSFLILFYVTDFGISAGNLALLVTTAEPSDMSMPAHGLGAIVFAIFATVFYLPLAMTSEKVEALDR